MNPEDFYAYLWDGHRFVHKPRGRICTWTLTPMYCENLRTLMLLAAMHEEDCS